MGVRALPPAVLRTARDISEGSHGLSICGLLRARRACASGRRSGQVAGCDGRLIIEPFHGFGIAVPSRALTDGDTDEEEEQARELAHALEDELVIWSQRYSDMQFVFINADCFGGTCLYSGYICQSGTILDRAKNASMSDGDGLPRLVRALGVELDDSGYFAPLTRGFFDTSR